MQIAKGSERNTKWSNSGSFCSFAFMLFLISLHFNNINLDLNRDSWFETSHCRVFFELLGLKDGREMKINIAFLQIFVQTFDRFYGD